MGILVPRLKPAPELGEVCFPASVRVEAWHCAMRCLQIRACLWALPSQGILRFLGQSSCESHRIIYLGRDFWRFPGASQSRISFEAAQGYSGPPDFLQAGIKMENLLQELPLTSCPLAEKLSPSHTPKGLGALLGPSRRMSPGWAGGSSAGRCGGSKLSFLLPKSNSHNTLPSSGGRENY